MRAARILLAIVATLALVGGIATTADAGGGPHRASTTIVNGPGGYGQVDPADPELPPDP
jgi:hypothetical protein